MKLYVKGAEVSEDESLDNNPEWEPLTGSVDDVMLVASGWVELSRGGPKAEKGQAVLEYLGETVRHETWLRRDEDG